jgi:hypothetical protein
MIPCDIGYAVQMLKQGYFVKRDQWTRTHLTHNPTTGIIGIMTVEGMQIAWSPTHEDLLAEDYVSFV